VAKAFQIKRMALSDLKDAPYNPRVISDGALEGLKNSLSRFGLVQPIVWNKRTKRIVGGHQRVKALIEMGETSAQVIVVDLPQKEEKALNITLNNPHVTGDFTDELSGILEDLRAEEFDDINLGDLEDDFDFSYSGRKDLDEVPKEKKQAMTHPGDLWKLGRHKILCGDNKYSPNWINLLGGGKADLCVVDPPFEMKGTYYMENVLSYCKGALVMHSDKNSVALAAAYNREFKYFLVHHYQNNSIKSSHIPITEHSLIGVYGKPKFRSKDAFKTVIKINKSAFDPDLKYQKPIDLLIDLVRHYSRRGNIIFDPFAGTGTTIVACELLSRNCLALEFDPLRVDVAVKRWEKFTGMKGKRIKGNG